MGHSAAEWDARHRSRGATDHVDPSVRSAVTGRTPGSAVDLGCGTGRHTRWLARLGWAATGIDPSPVGVQIAADAARDAGLDTAWVVGDATTWAPPAPVDLVVVAFVQVSDLAGRVAPWLAPGGRLVVVGHAVANATRGIGGPRDRRLLHDPGQMAPAARAAGLRVRVCGEVERAVDFGPDHGGRGIQVDAVLVADRPA